MCGTASMLNLQVGLGAVLARNSGRLPATCRGGRYLIYPRASTARIASAPGVSPGAAQMLPRRAWPGQALAGPGQSPPRPGAITPEQVSPASIRGSAKPSTVRYQRLPRLLDDLAMARAEGKYARQSGRLPHCLA